MKAVYCTRYGPPEALELRETPTPVPKDDEVLIRIHVTTVTMGDCELRTLTLPPWTRLPMRLFIGYRKPKNFIPGMELSGVVEAVGAKVTRLKPGDAVFASGGMRMGTYAEYKCLKASAAIAIKPSRVSFEEAATTIVGGINALHFLRKAAIQPGQSVLVIGGGGCIGSYGVQLAKLYGGIVTAVDRTDKLEMLKAIGADEVIDFTKENFWAQGKKYDVIFDTVYQTPFDECAQTLTENGCYLMANTDPARMFRAWRRSKKSSQRFVFSLAGETVPDLEYLATLIAEGKLKPAIDRRYDLASIREAHRYVESGGKKGCVIINVVK